MAAMSTSAPTTPENEPSDQKARLPISGTRPPATTSAVRAARQAESTSPARSIVATAARPLAAAMRRIARAVIPAAAAALTAMSRPPGMVATSPSATTAPVARAAPRAAPAPMPMRAGSASGVR